LEPHMIVETKSMGALAQLQDESVESQVTAKPRAGQRAVFFMLAVLGFSFWFWMAAPFATHREGYWWLAEGFTHGFSRSLEVISVTYRPLAQMTAWAGFMFLDPRAFPTSVARQMLLQGTVWGLFVAAWWFIYTAAREWRMFSVLAFVVGGAFFAGYVHLFHIYGIMYVPVMLTLGAVLRFQASRSLGKAELWLGLAGLLMVVWHPFATALVLAYCCGYYLETFGKRTRAQHVRLIALMVTSALAIAVVVVVFPRADVRVPFHIKLFGFLESYRATEMNRALSALAFLLAQLTVVSMRLKRDAKLAAAALISGAAIAFIVTGIPLLLLWMGAALGKLFRDRCWGLLLMLLAAALLPYGAIIGAPVFALFAIILATFVIAMGWQDGERALSWMKTGYGVTVIAALGIVVAMIRLGVAVPVVTRVATPLLAERERTYQLESALDWLRQSPYCSDEVNFAEKAGSPIDSAETAISRRNRPPASIEDVQMFWNRVLRCNGRRPGSTAVVTFGGERVPDATAVFEVEGKYAGEAALWIQDAGRGLPGAVPPASPANERFKSGFGMVPVRAQTETDQFVVNRSLSEEHR
jgi:hypothetical protein